MSSPSHRDLILDQFSRQAVPFSTAPGIKDEQALRLIVESTGAGPEDTVLDVACGGGIVVCAFARVVKHATGIDLTPAMLERAKAYAAEQGLTNVSWKQGDVLPLPYSDGAFSLVTVSTANSRRPEPRPNSSASRSPTTRRAIRPSLRPLWAPSLPLGPTGRCCSRTGSCSASARRSRGSF
jgi:SAM-dependent methyltransferase